MGLKEIWPVTAYLYAKALAKHSKPVNMRAIKLGADSDLPKSTTPFAALIKAELIDVTEDPEPFGNALYLYQLNKKGIEELAKQDAFALEDRQQPRTNTASKKESMPVVHEPPPPAPNLSVTAEDLMGSVTSVLEENASLRDFLTTLHKQLEDYLQIAPPINEENTVTG